MPLRLSLLGPPRVDVDGAPLAVDTRKAVAVLARLALSGVQSRDVLAELLWPDYPADRSRAALRRTLSALRSGLGGRWLETDRGQVALSGGDVWVDVAEFRSLAAAGGRPELERAVALHRGDLLEGFGLRDSAAFDDWQRAEAAALRAELEAALDALVASLEADGRHQEAVAHARRRLALDPLHEPSHRGLMRVLAASGHRAEALEQYRECVRTLDRELGVRPLPETSALYAAVSEGAPLPGAAGPRAVPEAGPAPAFVGRRAELELLAGEWRACAGGGRLVVVEGEAGVGKSRLLEEFGARVGAAGGLAVFARSHEGESGLPFGLAAAALRAAVDAAGGERAAALADHWRSEAARLVPELAAQAAPAGEAPGALQRLHEGVAQTLLALLGGDPAGVLVLDDLHAADAASVGLVAYLARRLGGRPLLVVTAWRPEEAEAAHAALRRPAARTLRLARLGRDEVAELAAAAGAGDQTDALFAQTDGLPLFVVEYLAALGEDRSELPGGVRDLLTSRLERVGETAAQLLGAAAVIGRSFDADLLRVASGRGDEETVAGLEELTRRGLIVERDDRYDFSHDRLLDVAYARTSLARRRLLHRRLAVALADAHGDPALVARHLEAAGRDAEAADAYRAAGDRARSLFASGEAVAAYAAALALGHPDAAGLHEAIGDQRTLRGEYRAALEEYEAAAALADPGRLGAIEHKVGRVYDRRGEPDLAWRHLDEALRLGGESARVQADRSLAAHRRGDDGEAVELARRALDLGGGDGDVEAVAQAENILGILTHDADHLERAVELAESLDDRGILVAALNNLALARRREGDADAAIALTERALGLCAERGDRHREAALRNNLADLLHAAGREPESMAELKRAVAIFAEIGADGDELQPEVWKLVEW